MEWNDMERFHRVDFRRRIKINRDDFSHPELDEKMIHILLGQLSQPVDMNSSVRIIRR